MKKVIYQGQEIRLSDEEMFLAHLRPGQEIKEDEFILLMQFLHAFHITRTAMIRNALSDARKN